MLIKFTYSCAVFLLTSSCIAQVKCSSVARDFRKSIVQLHVEKTHKTGAIDTADGTGFIVGRDGFIVTNNHVIAGGQDIDKVEITGAIASRNATRTPVLVITSDEQHDLALLQLENTSEVYQPVILGEPWNVSVGSVVCSLGFPLNTEFHFSRGTVGGKGGTKGWWTTDMPSNPGESGAPVFSDETGKVIALKVAGYDEAQNLNLIIPINFAAHLLLFVADAQSPGRTPPHGNSQPSNLPSGNRTIYNGFRYGGQSVLTFSTGQIGGWGSRDADIGVANPGGEKSLASFFLNNDSPPYTDPNAPSHDIENAGIIEMPTTNLDDVKECPDSDYKIHYFQPRQGGVYCVRTRDGAHFAKIKVSAISPDRISFDYVYQPSGSRSFE